MKRLWLRLAAGAALVTAAQAQPAVEPPTELLGCARVDNDFVVKNNCGFAVNVKYCGMAVPPGSRHTQCLPDRPMSLAAGAEKTFYLTLWRVMHSRACQAPLWPKVDFRTGVWRCESLQPPRRAGALR